MDLPGSRPGGRARVAPPADGLVLYKRARSSWRMSGKGANAKEQIPCPKCGSRVQRRNMRKHKRSVHQGVRRRRHVCPYCSAEKCKNHLQTHGQCLDDPLQREEYAAGFKLDRWERFHEIEGDETDRAYPASPLCEKTMANTRVRKRESCRDHRLPSAFLIPCLTETSHRRRVRVSREARARRKEKSRRPRVTSPDHSHE